MHMKRLEPFLKSMQQLARVAEEVFSEVPYTMGYVWVSPAPCTGTTAHERTYGAITGPDEIYASGILERPRII